MNRNQLRLLALAWILGACSAALPAQQAGVERLTTREGLSQGFISGLLQDSEGFIWAGTKNGLNRYDGYHFEVFTNDPYDDHTLSHDHINTISEFGEFLVIGTGAGGINIFHKKTHLVYRVPNIAFTGQTQLDISIVWSEVDAAGNIWVLAPVALPTQAIRLFKIILPAGFWQDPTSQPDWHQHLTIQVNPFPIWGIPCFDKDRKTMFMASGDSIYQMDALSGERTAITALTPGHEIYFNPDQTGNVYLSYTPLEFAGKAGNSRLGRLKVGHPAIKGQVLESIATPPKFCSIQYISKDYLWLNSLDEIQCYKFDTRGNFYPAEPEIPPIRVPEGHCYCFTDRSGIVWIGTNGLGIIKINLRAKHFHHLFAGHSIYNSILQDRYGNICTHSNIPVLLISTEFAHGPALPFLSGLNFYGARMLQDHSGNYWISTSDPSNQFFLQKTSLSGVTTKFRPPTPLLKEYGCSLMLDRQDHPWVATNTCLLHFDPGTEQYAVFDYQSVMPESQNVNALAQTGDGSWWIATSNGLLRGKPKGQGFDFQLYKNDPLQRNSLRNNLVATLLADPKDPFVLWIGTKGGGLDRLDVRTGVFTNLGLRNGLPNDVIYGILDDEDGNLWMSSNKGLIRYTPATGLIKNYTEADGLQANEFNTWAYGKGPDGMLLFGGVNGLNLFDPKELQGNPFPPLVQINGLLLNDQDISRNDTTGILTQAVEFTREIVVPYFRNNITLTFTALDFASPGKNRFRYYLEGAEAPWTHESTEHSAPYLNLAPGHYTFKVKGANSDGIWNETPTELKITVLPPWYLTWWAWVFYFAVVTGTVYFVNRYQLRQKLEHAEHGRLKELDAFKSRFFTNMTHEFRTPLTVILGTAEQLTGIGNQTDAEVRLPKTKFLHQLGLIRRNGENLLRLINEILDLAKLEDNSLKIHYIQADVLAYLRYISESLHSLANAKNVLLRVESEQARIVMDYDPERLLQIVHNLLSNAVKFTPSGGRVLLTANTRPDGTAEQLVLAVSDTGIGIPADDLPAVFDRFYQGKNQEQAKTGGTGVGLSLTRELVKAMGGQISAESQPGRQTTFTVLLPLTRQAAPGSWKDAGGERMARTGPTVPLPVAGPQNGAQPSLLIIEDNPDVVEYLTDCLSDRYRLHYAYNGRAGIEKTFELAPDIIISDVMMPEKDGLEVCDTLKNDARSSHIPIVLLTAKASLSDRIAGLRRGADAYLAKPFHQEELLVQLHRLLESRQKLQARYMQLSLSAEQPAPSTPDTALEDAFLTKLRTYLQDNLANARLAPEDICRAMGMGRTNLHNKLQALTGMPVTLYLRALRLRQARELLRNPALNISEVAYEVGFDDPKYFSRVFSEEFGQPPSALRG